MRNALWSSLLVGLMLAGCNGGSTSEAGKDGEPSKPATTGSAPTFTKLEIKDTTVGKGPKAATGDSVWVTYVGKFTNGSVFDSSERNGDKPFKVTIGAGEVIKGWEEGLVGAQAGTKRELKIPYKLAYGEAGKDPIPPKSDLVFDVEVLALIKAGDEGVVDGTDIKVGNGPVVKNGSKITVNYVGTLVNGTEFDSTKTQGKPFVFTVGNEETLKGIDVGVVGMKKGGKRRLMIPPELGLKFGNATVPANNPLIIEIEVIDVK